MEKYLLIGNGELFLSVVNQLPKNPSHDLITILPFEKFLSLHRAAKEKVNFDNLCHLQNFNRIYLLPENLHEGLVYTSFISEWYKGNLFIVAQEPGASFLYKKLGADYVIISKPHSRYPWLPDMTKENYLN